MPPQITLGSRLLAGFGTLALAAAIGLALAQPSHSVGGPVAVSVANTPLSTNAVDNPDKQAIQFAVTMEIANGNPSVQNVNVYTVPAGKRLVIETVSGLSNFTGDTNHYTIYYVIRGGLGDEQALGSLSLLPDGSPLLRGVINTLGYVDAGESVSLVMMRPVSTGFSSIIVSFTGHLVNIPGPGL